VLVNAKTLLAGSGDMKGKVRQQDKEKTLELLSDHELHTKSEIEAATGNWFVPLIIQHLRADGHLIRSHRRLSGFYKGKGVYCYELMGKRPVQLKSLFD
jgi:hypothetical protein